MNIAGAGSVTSNIGGINCGTDCNKVYNHGTTVTLTATPDATSTFTGWSGGCMGTGTCTVTVNSDTTVTASFTLNTYTVTTTATNGAITSTITPTVNHGSTMTVTGTANANHYFTGVSGCGGTTRSNTNQSATTFSYITGAITGNCTVTATFAITDTTTPAFTSTAPASNSYINTATVGYTLSAAVASGSITFSQTGGTTGPSSPYGYNFTDADKTSGTHSVNTGASLINGAIYTLTFDALDAAGNAASTVSNTSITYDAASASVVINSPASNGLVNNSNVSYTLSEAISSGNIVFTATGGNTDALSPHTYTLAGGELTAGAHNITTGITLVDGAVYTISLENVLDAAGNTTATVSNIGITYDSTSVAITGTTPAANAVINAATVGYTLSEAASGGKVTFTWTGGNADTGSPHVYNLSGSELYPGTQTVNTSLPLVDGAIYTVSFDAADMAGNPATTVSNANVTFDTTVPTVSATSPATGASDVPIASTITATFSEAMDASTINGTTFTLSGGVTGTVTYDSGTKTATFTPSANLAYNSTYSATLTTGVKDLAGKAIAADYTWSFTTAAIPSYFLTVTKTGTGSGSAASVPAGIDCGGTCSSGFNLGTSVTLSATPDTGSTFTGWFGACSDTGACNVTMTGPATVTAQFDDITPPTLKISALPDGGITQNTTFNISGTVTDNMTVQSLLISGVTITVNPDNTFSYALPLSAGTNTVTTIAADAAGNEDTDIRMITLDLTAPHLTVTSPADNSVTNQVLSRVTGVVDETATVTVALNSGSTQTAVMSGITFSTTVSLAAGMNNIDIAAKDLAGNTSSEKRTITYDQTAPSVAITSPAHDITISRPTVMISGTISDAVTQVAATITVDGAASALIITLGAFSQAVTFTAEGQHVITVTATDQAGNSATAQRNIIYTKLGDLDNSGAVDLIDALRAFKHAMGKEPITDPVVLKRCDVAPLGPDGKPNPDGRVDIGDVIIILRKIVGLVNW